MPALQVKDCPDNVYEKLRKCAADENRSISQQTLTILEQYLGLRDGGTFPAQGPRERASTIAPAKVGFFRAEDRDGASFLARRQKAFERIHELSPIPIDGGCPSTIELLAQSREEDAS